MPLISSSASCSLISGFSFIFEAPVLWDFSSAFRPRFRFSVFQTWGPRWVSIYFPGVFGVGQLVGGVGATKLRLTTACRNWNVPAVQRVYQLTLRSLSDRQTLHGGPRPYRPGAPGARFGVCANAGDVISTSANEAVNVSRTIEGWQKRATSEQRRT